MAESAKLLAASIPGALVEGPCREPLTVYLSDNDEAEAGAGDDRRTQRDCPMEDEEPCPREQCMSDEVGRASPTESVPSTASGHGSSVESEVEAHGSRHAAETDEPATKKARKSLSGAFDAPTQNRESSDPFPWQLQYLPAEANNAQALTCAACKHKVQLLERHPFFDVGVCVSCLDEKLDPPQALRYRDVKVRAGFHWKLEDGQEIYCRCCGDGGDLHLCDGPPHRDAGAPYCVRTLCVQCVRRWHPQGDTHPDETDLWLCPACQSGDRFSARKSGFVSCIQRTQLADIRKDQAKGVDPSAAKAQPEDRWRKADQVVERVVVDKDVTRGRENVRIPLVVDVQMSRLEVRRLQLWDAMERSMDGRAEGGSRPGHRKLCVVLTLKDEGQLATMMRKERAMAAKAKAMTLVKRRMPDFTYVTSNVLGEGLAQLAPHTVCVVGCVVGCDGSHCRPAKAASAETIQLRKRQWTALMDFQRARLANPDSPTGECAGSDKASSASSKSTIPTTSDAPRITVPMCSWMTYNGHAKQKYMQDITFECNLFCKCDAASCHNRVVQRGIRRPLEACGGCESEWEEEQVFWTHDEREWGVRCTEDLDAGAFVCEYAGELLTEMEAEAKPKDQDLYLLDLPCPNERMSYRAWMQADQQVKLDTRNKRTDEEEEDEEDAPGSNTDTVIDALRFGNVGRFLNHRCDEGNLVKQLVLIDTFDLRRCRVAFFAADFIPANTELTYDYGLQGFSSQLCALQLETHCRSESEVEGGARVQESDPMAPAGASSSGSSQADAQRPSLRLMHQASGLEVD